MGEIKFPGWNCNFSIHRGDTFEKKSAVAKLKFTFLIIAVCLLSCKKASNDFTSRITFLNGSVGAQPLSVNFNSDTAITNLRFGNLVPFRSVPSGTFNVNFFSGASTSPALTFLTNFKSGIGYTCFLYDSSSKSKLFFQEDNIPSGVTEGKCAIRFFSLIPSTATVSLLNDTNRIFISAQSFNNYSNSFQEVDTTNRAIKLIMTGISTPLDSVARPLVAGKKYTIFVNGTVGGSGAEKPRMLFIEHYSF